MRRVIGQHRQQGVPIPEADGFQKGIDLAFRFGAQSRIFASGITRRADLAIRPENTPIGRDPVDPRLPQTICTIISPALSCYVVPAV